LTDADIINIFPISNEITDVLGYFLVYFRALMFIAFVRCFMAERHRKF
jgi:hypothetical protein